jgi:2-oxoisovalerate dehydrogenase E1 component
MAEGVLTDSSREAIRAEFKAYIESGVQATFNEPDIVPDTAEELRDVYAPFNFLETRPSSSATTKKRLIDAISDGLALAMEKHPQLVLMGQDIAEYGGVFKITEGFVERFGKERVRNTPLCEAAIVGAGLGLSIKGRKAMVEMQFADFVTEGFNQIVNNLAKIHYRWGQNADVVIRMPTGAGVAAGPFHSQSNEAWFTHTPGLKVVYPAFPNDAKGLLLAAFEDPNPVMFFEHKALYRSISEEVFDDYFTLPIGKAKLLREGNQVSIITYGFGVHWALEILDKHPEINADLIDLRTLLPLDEEAIFESVRKTGRAIVFHEDCLTGGIGGEIASRIMEQCFEQLDAPVMRSASLDTPVPFSEELENNFLPKARFEEQLLKLVEY